MEVTADELAILSRLDVLVFQEDVLRHIQRQSAELEQQLNGRPSAAFMRAELPLAMYGAHLPPAVCSSNVYVIRPRVSSGFERHPNSHQRSMSLSGRGEFVLGSAEERRRYLIASGERRSVAKRWVSIPPNTWHEAIAGEAPWTVVTFHTATDTEIINERATAMA